MYTDEELVKLEEEEHEHAVEQFALLLLLFDGLSDDLKRELTLFYKEYGTDGIVSYYQSRQKISKTNKTARQVALFLLIDKLFEQLFEDFQLNYDFHVKYIIDRESNFFNLDVDIEDVLLVKWGADSLNWLERLMSYKQKWLDTIYADLKRGFLKRDNINTVLDLLDGRINSMKKALWKHYVSESTATNSIVRQKIFKEMGVTKYRFYTREDERTCEQCGSLHGLIFPMSAFEVGVTASPIHPHCRCFEIPVMD